MHILFSLIVVFLLYVPSAVFAEKAKSIIYIPIDNRPVSLGYVQETFALSGVQLITPPEHLLSSHEHNGSPDALMNWLIKNASRANSAVIAADSLVYGGLVSSRTHNEDVQTLLKRAQAINMIKYANKGMKIYVYSSLMRTPRKSTAFVEPAYYEEYGPWFFRLSQLLDKEDLNGGLNILDATEKNNYQILIPQEYQNDWFARRKKNLAVHNFLIDSFKAGYFNSLTIGKDDNAPLSQTHYEARMLNKNIPAFNANISILPGIDQLGMLLLTKALFASDFTVPKINVIYNTGVAGETVPSYSDQNLASSVFEQLRLLGGEYAFNAKDADIVLAVNSPENGVTLESADYRNVTSVITRDLKFAQEIDRLALVGTKVAVADVAYSNGSSNSFMKSMSNLDMFDKIYSYSGWNTADNTIGYAIAQGLLAANMKKIDRTILIKTRLLDDWIYQSNVRKDIVEQYFTINPYKQYSLGKDRDKYTAEVARAMGEEVSYIPYLNTTRFMMSLPWSRVFEINIRLVR